MAKRSRRSRVDDSAATTPRAVEPPRAPKERARVVRVEESLAPAPQPFGETVDDSGVSLDELGAAYSALLQRAPDPYKPAPMPEPSPEISDDDKRLIGVETVDPQPIDAVDDGACWLSPRSIVEAMLFVGDLRNEPLAANRAAGLMRGVAADEIHEIVAELDAEYRREGRPYEVVSEGVGYRMRLRPEFVPAAAKLLGRAKETKLSQSAIDVLAIVAYQQPITTAEIDALRGRASAATLNLLTRKNLVKIERVADKPREVRYVVSKRFLDLFGLASIEDLPQGVDLER